MNAKDKAEAARKAFLALANASSQDKNDALSAVADAIDEGRLDILAANKLDVEAAERLHDVGGLSGALVDRLKLSDDKVNGIIDGIESLIRLEDPVGKTIMSRELDEGLILFKVSVPIGVLGVVFESRPDVVPQVASLALKSGNAVVMKGGSEAAHSNKMLAEIISQATESCPGIPSGWLQLIETREEVRDLLALDDLVSLMIPRGGNEFVKYIQDNTRIPVLGHADGICHVYVDEDADLETALKVCFDAKCQYPAVCNAMETLLVHESIARDFLPGMISRYKEAGVELRGDERTCELVGSDIRKATLDDWSTEYNDLILSIKIVASLDEAIEHINTYGSGHTDAIITKNDSTARRFLEEVDSSSVMHNCSTRFADGFRYGLGAEVGISTNKIHARGPVGLEGLTIYKYVLEGAGHVVADYSGGNARRYTHKKIVKKW